MSVARACQIIFVIALALALSIKLGPELDLFDDEALSEYQGCPEKGPAVTPSASPLEATAESYTEYEPNATYVDLVHVERNYENLGLRHADIGYSNPWSSAFSSQPSPLTLCAYVAKIGAEMKTCNYFMVGSPAPGDGPPPHFSIRKATFTYQLFETRTGELLGMFQLDALNASCPDVAHREEGDMPARANGPEIRQGVENILLRAGNSGA
ncbi:hypothetical protein [Streptomyces sp. NPDC056405]|uniref:hypothetical protein n=1 Tax=Streptomyces sp. NPDC056405 TaxID=3345811 RepID=UPI0035D9D07C